MANSRSRHISWSNFGTTVNLDSVSTEACRCDNRFFKRLPKTLESDRFFELKHRVSLLRACELVETRCESEEEIYGKLFLTGSIVQSQLTSKIWPAQSEKHVLKNDSELSGFNFKAGNQVTTIKDVCGFLDSFAPTRLAEEWDNVGLLVGDPAATLKKAMTCLTVTQESAAEAIDKKVDLIVSHHPLPFRPLKRLTTDTTPSRLLWDLIRAGVSIYSPHTGFDSASEGINQSLGERIGMTEMVPLVPIKDDPHGLGAGRTGKLASPKKLGDFVDEVKKSFGLPGIHIVGEPESSVEVIGVACGSGGSFLEKARRAKCDTFVTGEATFHTCLEAKAQGISLVLLGHYASERFAVEALSDRLASKFTDVEVWASNEESDPLSWV